MTSGNERLSLSVGDGFEAHEHARAKPHSANVSLYTDVDGVSTSTTAGRCFPTPRERTRIFASTRA